MSLQNTVGKREIATFFEELTAFFIGFKIAVCKLFNFVAWEKVKMVENESTCRRHIKVRRCEEKKGMLGHSISPFSTRFLKSCFFRHVWLIFFVYFSSVSGVPKSVIVGKRIEKKVVCYRILTLCCTLRAFNRHKA